MLSITSDSHTDHNLNADHLAFILASLASAPEAFAIVALTVPGELPGVGCGLHGPAMGDEPIGDAECHMGVRGGRTVPSRLCSRTPRLVRTITAIVGMHEGRFILYTAFGGPAAPREPGDPGLATDALRAESAAFWSQHALSE